MSGRFVFLDRDGTLIEDRGFVHRLEDYAPIPGAFEALRVLRDGGYRLAIVTNQSGIGSGRFSADDFERFQAHLTADLEARALRIEATYVCPHAPDAGCRCRKPAPGLLERARDELGADLARSWVVGDKPIDAALAERAGCRAVYVLTGQGARRRSDLPPAVPIAADLLAAARHILVADGSDGEEGVS